MIYIQPDKTISSRKLEVEGWEVSGELERKIQEHYPHFEFVTDGGALLDIEPYDPPEHEGEPEPFGAGEHVPRGNEELWAAIDDLQRLAGLMAETLARHEMIDSAIAENAELFARYNIPGVSVVKKEER